MKVKAFFIGVLRRTAKNKVSLGVFLTLRLIVYGVLVFSLAHGEWAHAAICVLSLVLLFTPFCIEQAFSVVLPTYLTLTVLLFVFSATVLGEIASLYVKLPIWDSLLHTLNGALCAGVGYSLAGVLNRRKKIELSPLFLAVVAFTFAVSVSVFWEFFEFAADTLFHADMQKDVFINSISSVALDPTLSNAPVRVDGIVKTVLFGVDGQELLSVDGYLDVGLRDTMKDLLLGTLGGLVFCLVRYFSTYDRRAERWTEKLLPSAKTD